MAKKTTDIFAAIHLGSEKISLKIIEYRSLNSIKLLDSAEKRVRMGEETFKTGKVPSNMVKEICTILNNFKAKMREYDVTQYKLVGTTAMREAHNSTLMIDQIYMATGLRVQVIDMPLEIYYKYIYTVRLLRDNDIFNEGISTLFADISSGGLGVTLTENKIIKYQQNLSIGVIRLKERFDKNQRSSNSFNNALNEYISSIMSPVSLHLKGFDINRIILTGSNINLLLKMLHIKNDKQQIITVKTAKFKELHDRVVDMTLAKIMKEFDLTEQVAEVVLPTIIFYQQLITLTKAPQLVFPPTKFIDSLLLFHLAKEKNSSWLEELDEEIMDFIYNTAKYYKYDSKHAKQICRFSELIFDRMAKIHRLDSRCRLILRTVAILHDIGKFIKLRQHYFYSYRLIRATDIFCLSDAEKSIAAYTAYHHAVDFSEPTPDDMAKMNNKQLSIVAKLASILRVADALDRSYRQKITDCKVALKNNELQIIVKNKEDLALERWTLETKSNMFVDVFGIQPVLIEKNN